MKRLFTILTTLALLCAVGCEEQGDDNVNPNDKPNTEQPGEKPDDGSEIPDDAYISINKEVLTFSPDGESVDVNVYSNYEWTLTNNCDWVTTSVVGGEASEGGTTITISADLAYDDREGTIIFSCGKAREVLVVSQSLKEVIIADENNTFSVPAEGGNVIINYQTSVECEVIIPDKAKEWITFANADATRGLVAENINLNIAENTTYSKRSAVIKVVKVGDNTLFAEYTINQVQNNAIIADKNNTINLGGWAQSINIAYQTNVECEVVIPEEAQSWISIVPATRALVYESATLNIAENNTGAERSAVVKVVAANNNELLAEYTITQNQRYFMEYTSKDGFTVSPHSSAFGATIIRNEYIDGKGYIDFDAPITSIGRYAFDECRSLTSITIPDSVTSIGIYAFSDCTSLTSITIPDSVTKIGNSAFEYCTSLTNFYGRFASEDGRCLIIDGVLNSFAPAGLTEYTIPDSVTEIGEDAFAYCSSLKSITIPDSVTSIGSGAFYGCTSLTSVTIPDSVTKIGNSAFEYCTLLTSVTIGNGVTKIGNSAFEYCTSLTNFYGRFASEDGRCLIIDGVLNSFAPAGLTEYTIPASVTSIGNSAFANCTSLKSVTIGNGVTSIGEDAFQYCDSLTSVTIPNSVTSIGGFAFYNCTSLTSITIPASVTSIGKYAFAYCSSLKSITIPDSVTSIGDSAFYYCSSLTSVTIPDSVTSIGEDAFFRCTSLTSVTIGSGVTSIGEYAFNNCTSLKKVYCKATTPPAGDEYMFAYNASGRKIYVPTESVDAYKAAEGWSVYANNIEGYDF